MKRKVRVTLLLIKIINAMKCIKQEEFENLTEMTEYDL